MRIARAPFLPNNGLRTLLRSIVGGDVFAGRRHRAAHVSSRRCGRLFSTAAAASDDAPSVRRNGKRLSRQERTVLVESFVNKYRNLNEGKFPNISLAQKEVGGCYYVIREILQELQYNAVQCPTVEIYGKSLVKEKGVENEDRSQDEYSQGAELSSSQSQGDREVEGQLYEVEMAPHAEEKACKKNMQVLGDKFEAEVEKTVDEEAQREATGVKDVYGQSLSRDFVGRIDGVSIDQKLVCEEKGVEKEDRPKEEYSLGAELSSSQSQADREVEGQLYEVEKAPHAEEKACKKNIQVLGDKFESGVEKTVDAEAQREATFVKDVYGQPLSRDFVGRTDGVSTDQKLVCEEAVKNSSIEHDSNLLSDEIKKHPESRKTSYIGSFSEKTLLVDTSNSSNKEDKDEFQVTSSSLQAEGSSTMSRTGEPALVFEEVVKSASYDGSRVPSVGGANDKAGGAKDKNLQEPSLWSSLKSFADSVFGIWRKR